MIYGSVSKSDQLWCPVEEEEEEEEEEFRAVVQLCQLVSGDRILQDMQYID